MSRSVAAAFLLGATAFAVQPPDRPLYFPTKVGTTWEYDDGGGTRAATKTVSRVEKTQRGWEVSVRADKAPGEAGDDKVLVSERGVFVMADADAKYSPPLCVLKLPATPGEAWDVTAPKIAGKATTAGEEPVEVPAGKYKAVRVDTTMALGGTTVKRSTWYAPGVGLVKATEDGKTLFALRRFTPGKD